MSQGIPLVETVAPAIDHPTAEWQKASAREAIRPRAVSFRNSGAASNWNGGRDHSLRWATSSRYAWAHHRNPHPISLDVTLPEDDGGARQRLRIQSMARAEQGIWAIMSLSAKAAEAAKATMSAVERLFARAACQDRSQKP
jgi:hypothetical protein